MFEAIMRQVRQIGFWANFPISKHTPIGVEEIEDRLEAREAGFDGPSHAAKIIITMRSLENSKKPASIASVIKSIYSHIVGVYSDIAKMGLTPICLNTLSIASVLNKFSYENLEEANISINCEVI